LLQTYSLNFSKNGFSPVGQFSSCPLLRQKNSEFTFIAFWVDSQMIVGTAKGEVLIFINSEMAQSFIYERPKQGSLEDESRVTQIRVFSEGFVVGH